MEMKDTRPETDLQKEVDRLCVDRRRCYRRRGTHRRRLRVPLAEKEKGKRGKDLYRREGIGLQGWRDCAFSEGKDFRGETGRRIFGNFLNLYPSSLYRQLECNDQKV